MSRVDEIVESLKTAREALGMPPRELLDMLPEWMGEVGAAAHSGSHARRSLMLMWSSPISSAWGHRN